MKIIVIKQKQFWTNNRVFPLVTFKNDYSLVVCGITLLFNPRQERKALLWRTSSGKHFFKYDNFEYPLLQLHLECTYNLLMTSEMCRLSSIYISV